MNIPYSDSYLRSRAEEIAGERPERAHICRVLRSETEAPHRQIKRIVKAVLEGET